MGLVGTMILQKETILPTSESQTPTGSNLTSLLINALKAVPESHYIVSIVNSLDCDGNYIGDPQYEPWCIATLKNIIEYGKEAEEKYHKLCADIDNYEGDSVRQRFAAELDELRKLDEIVGTCRYIDCSSLCEFLDMPFE